MADVGQEPPEFVVRHQRTPSRTLLAGFTAFGLAGLTAVDFLVDHLELEQQGHVTAAGLPTITPFEEGRPRHHTRLFSRDDLDVTLLVSELPVPTPASDRFAEAILEWTAANGVDEIVVVSGVPIPHGPDAHRTFYVATDDYRERRLDSDLVPPMGSGFLGGTNAAFVQRGLDSPLGVCVLVTPIHAPAPDVDAAVRLVETVESIYGLGVDTEPLAAFADDVRRYYADLAEHVQSTEEDVPEDRMYM